MHWQSWLKLIGIVLLAWILSTVNWDQAIRTLVQLNPGYMIGYVACFVAMVLVRSLRLRLALSRLDYQLTYRDCYVATLEPAFMGVVTPGRLGEFTRVGYIHAHGVPMQEAISVVALERLIDLYVLLIFGAAGITYIFAPAPYHLGSGFVLLAGLVSFYGAIRNQGPMLRLLQKYLGWLLRWEPTSWSLHRRSLTTTFRSVSKRVAMQVMLLGLVCIALNFSQIFLLAKAFRFEADYLVVMFAYAAATLVSLLPISVGGLGTREATYIMIMAREGILKEQALLFSLMDGVVLGIFGLFLLILPIWILRIGKR